MAIRGIWDDNFARVADAFGDLLDTNRIQGGACAVYVGGALVADVWTGWSDNARTSVWDRDTLAPLSQAGTILTPLAMLIACEAHRHQLGDPVSLIWPDFGRNSKTDITHRQVLSHRAGLAGIDRSRGTEHLLNWDEVVMSIANSSPEHPPGTVTAPQRAVMSHACGEVLCRLDSRPVREAVAERLQRPLFAEVHLGLAQSDLPRCSEPTRDQGATAPSVLGTTAARLASSPTLSSHGTAQGLARCYKALIDGGRRADQSAALSSELRSAILDTVEGPDSNGRSHGLGVTHGTVNPGGGAARGSGQRGTGITLGFVDPEAELAVGLVSPLVGPAAPGATDDLMAAIYDSL